MLRPFNTATMTGARVSGADDFGPVFGAVNNVLDKDPPNYLNASFGPTNSVLYDVLGRNYRVGVRVAF